MIDDELDILMIVDMCLTATQRNRVLTASNGHDGLRLARTERPDVILLDVMMPGISGYEVIQRLKADAATVDIPVIFLTARAGRRDIEKGLAIGAIGYFTKPFETAALSRQIDDLLGSAQEA